jgi:hypothetical protein
MTILRLITILSDYIIPQITSYILPCIHMYDTTHQKTLKTGIIAAILLVTVILTTQQQPIQASDDNDDNNNCAGKPILAEILCGTDDALTGYNQGKADGKNAGLRGESNQCPQSNDVSGYCLGWGSGWIDGADARKDMESLNGGNNNNNNNNNNNGNDNDGNDNGNREDDGEFVPRVIQQQDVPKRVIGQD